MNIERQGLGLELRTDYSLSGMMEQEIEFVPSLELTRYVANLFPISVNPRISQKVAKQLPQWVCALGEKRSGFQITAQDVERFPFLNKIGEFSQVEFIEDARLTRFLFHSFLACYYTFNFAASLLGIEARIEKYPSYRGQFLKITSGPPYDLSEDGSPAGLNIYHRLQDQTLKLPSPFCLSQPPLEERIFEQTEMANRHLKDAAKSVLKAFKKNPGPPTQLGLLVEGVILPSMFGLDCQREAEFTDACRTYEKSIETYGEYVIPLPVFFQEVNPI